MRVPDLILNCVGFIGEAYSEKDGDLHATGFFVSVPLDTPPHRVIFFVTAKHIAQDLQGKNVYITVNRKGGGITDLSAVGEVWWLHPTDQTADVALLPCNVNPETDDVSAIPIERFATLELMHDKNIGVGDEVFSTGLFTPVPGYSRNMPIVRHGNIAMLPIEQIDTELGYANVYLVEARSIGGLSGSPAFVRETLAIQMDMVTEKGTVFLRGVGEIYFLGLMQGHWDVKESEINRATITHDRKRGVNLGICMVVPAVKIAETLNQEGLVEMRKKMDEKIRANSMPNG